MSWRQSALSSANSGPYVDAATFELEARKEAARLRNVATRRAVSTGVLALIIFVAVWWGLVAAGVANPLFVSTPLAVLTAFVHLVGETSTWYDVWQTLYASIMALILGGGLGVAGGVVFASSSSIRRGLNPYVAIMNGIPRPALAPIFILWFGLGAAPKVLVGASLVFFVLLLNTIVGMTTIDQDIETLSKSMGMKRGQYFLYVQLPSALPSILAGLRLGAVYSVLGVVVSEIVASRHGLGQLLISFTNALDLASAFAVVALMAALAVSLDLAVRLLENAVLP